MDVVEFAHAVQNVVGTSQLLALANWILLVRSCSSFVVESACSKITKLYSTTFLEVKFGLRNRAGFCKLGAFNILQIEVDTLLLAILIPGFLMFHTCFFFENINAY